MTNQMDTDWTPERIARLTELWASGITAAAIGKSLGITKSAVVGKAHRLDLPGRPSPIPGGPRGRLTWTEADEQRAAMLRRSGMAYRDIAKKMPGHGAGGIASKLERMGVTRPVAALSFPVPAQKPRAPLPEFRLFHPARAAFVAAPQPRPAVVVAMPAPRPDAFKVPRPTACQYPHGEPRTPEFRFCGDPTIPGRSYCATHQAICYYRTDRQEAVA